MAARILLRWSAVPAAAKRYNAYRTSELKTDETKVAMNSLLQKTIWTVALIMTGILAMPVAAQQDDPKLKKEQPKDVAVEAILATKPATPAECIRAAKILFELKRPDLAKTYLKKVLDANLTGGELVELGRKVGTGMFIELANRKELLPEAKKLADAVNAAILSETHNAERIDKLIHQLQDPSAKKRLLALIGLQEARDAAIVPLIAVLADSKRGIEHRNVRAALVEMGRSVFDPLTAAVVRSNPKLAVQVIETLGVLGDRRAVPYLLAPCLAEDCPPKVKDAAAKALKRLIGIVPDRADAIKMLTDSARAYFDRGQPVEGADDGKTQVWRWNESKWRCDNRTVSAADAARALADRWARDAYSLAQHERELRLLHLTTMLEAAAYKNGLNRPLDEKNPAVVEAERFGVEPLEEVLAYGMKTGHTAAAAAAARIMGRIGTADELLNHFAGGSEPSPLVAALRSPDRRLRLAAAAAIVRLQPVRQFAGSSLVTEVLGFLASSRGERSALAVSPKLEEARDLAGWLASTGYQSDAVANGRDLLLRAAQTPDCEVVLMSVTIDRPTADALLQQLRHDPRTARLRVGVIAPAGRYEQAERIAGNDPLAKAFPRPRDEKAFKWQLKQLAALDAEDSVGFEARQIQAAEALDLLAAIAKTSNNIHDLRRVEAEMIVALSNPNPAIAARAAEVLAEMNSAVAQRTLADTVSRFTRPLAVRQAAAVAFRKNLEKYGLRLTKKEIQRQYDVYNGSENRDVATRQLLSFLLDCIEAAGPVQDGQQEK